MKFFKKPYLYAGLFSLFLIMFTAYALLDTFVIPHTLGYVTKKQTTDNEGDSTQIQDQSKNLSSLSEEESDNSSSLSPDQSEDSSSHSWDETNDSPSQSQEKTVTATSYTDENISISIETLQKYHTNIYVADIQVSDASYLKTALASNTFGTNITQKTSEMAASSGAILAINGDYYGADSKGYVIKNGELYRSTPRSDSENQDLVIYQDGSFGLINEDDISAEALVENGVVQLFAFGPALIENSSITVSQNEEVTKAMSSNPRTAIGVIDSLHYIFVVSDGRSSESEGLSLYELADIMSAYNCTLAYNLDGGGSSTMVFNGSVINKPTTSGRKISERSVSDIVYIGY